MKLSSFGWEDATILQHHDEAVLKRAHLELQIVRKTIRTLKAQGFNLAIDDSDEEPTEVGNELAALKLIFDLDECYLIVSKAGVNRGWVRFVRGNDGWDVICDYTVNLEAALREVNAFAEKLEEQS